MVRVINRSIHFAFYCALLLILISGSVRANGVVVNEVLVNEPSGRVSLEWIELFNDSQTPISLLDDSLMIDNQFIGVLGDVTIPSAGFVVVTRNATSFEEHFGDSSGVWGDDSLLESFAITQLSFSLRNAAGIVSLQNDTLITSMSWQSSGADGVSWERVSSSSDSVAQSRNLSGSTPGLANSVSQLSHDWEIVSVSIIPSRKSSTEIAVTLRNAGLSVLPSACLVVYDNPVLAPSSLFGMSGDSLSCESFVELAPAEIVTVSLEIMTSSIYDTIGIAVSGFDERRENNIRIITIPGADFPPLVINEFLPYPQEPLGSEWVELKNVSSMPIDIRGWMIGDELGFGKLDTTGSTQLTIEPGGYLVFAQDPSDFDVFYRLLSLPNSVIGWRTLNNSGDLLRLQDPFGFAADSIEYVSVFADNVTWSRSEEADTKGIWGLSIVSGGTPGDSNLTVLNPSSSDLVVNITPNPFSPDGDGFDEAAQIEIESPDGDDLSVVIYDSHGQEIRHLYFGAPFSGSIEWDGLDDSNRRVAIGIYIVLIDIEHVVSVKKTVVVAR